MSEWDGKERRSFAEMREVIREEIEPLRANQEEIQRKIADWESGAKWFRMFIITTVSFVTGGAALYEWVKAHIK